MQLDKLGIAYKHLPVTSPFSVYLDKNDPEPKENSKGKMTNQKLLEAMDSVEAFDKIYMVGRWRSAVPSLH